MRVVRIQCIEFIIYAVGIVTVIVIFYSAHFQQPLGVNVNIDLVLVSSVLVCCVCPELGGVNLGGEWPHLALCFWRTRRGLDALLHTGTVAQPSLARVWHPVGWMTAPSAGPW